MWLNLEPEAKCPNDNLTKKVIQNVERSLPLIKENLFHIHVWFEHRTICLKDNSKRTQPYLHKRRGFESRWQGKIIFILYYIIFLSITKVSQNKWNKKKVYKVSLTYMNDLSTFVLEVFDNCILGGSNRLIWPDQ